MLEVKLAGYNVDADALQSEIDGVGEANQPLTPETLSAAYARISRSKLSLCDLRSDACREVQSARKTNEQVIFGFGHGSIAEHAVFNIDISGISRLVVELLESHRLASYTERSQRYVNWEVAEWVTPQELEDYPELSAEFKEYNVALGRLYKQLVEAGVPQEDARYVLPLCTETQLGLTCNARSLELIINRLVGYKLREAWNLGDMLYSAVYPVAPSVFTHYSVPNYASDYGNLENLFVGVYPDDCYEEHASVATYSGARVDLVSHTEDPDCVILSGMGFPCSGGDRWRAIRHAEQVAKQEFFEVLNRMELWDEFPRAYELVDFMFKIELSASAFAQLKRHRMAILIVQPYDLSLGIDIPKSAVGDIAVEDMFYTHVEHAGDLYSRIGQVTSGAVASYVLTNAHKRRVLFKINARSLGHFSRLRCDDTAQWEIREIANRMVELAQGVMPVAGSFFGGKDKAAKLKKGLATKCL